MQAFSTPYLLQKVWPIWELNLDLQIRSLALYQCSYWDILELVWGIKLKKVDLSWPGDFSKPYNPSWIELNFLSSPWIELTQILHICPRLDLTQVEPTNSSQLRVDPKLKKINFSQVNSRKSWKNLNFFKNILDELISIIPKYLFWMICSFTYLKFTS